MKTNQNMGETTGAALAPGWWGRGLALLRRPVASYTVAVLAGQSVNMVAGLLVMRWLGPAEMGVWQSMLTLETYCLVLRLGVINGMNRQLPFMLGQGDRAGALQHAETTLGFTMVTAGILLGSFAAAALCWPGLDATWQLSLLTLACYTPCGLYSAFNEATYRGSRTFATLGWLILCNALLGLALLALLPAWGYAGQCVRLVVMAVAHAICTAWLRPLDVKPRLSMPVLRKLLKVGLPLYFQNYFARASLGVGSLVLLWIGGPKALGYFAPAGATLAVVGMVPNALQSYLQPQLHYEYGRDGSRHAVIAKSTRTATLMLGAALPLALVGVVCLPWAVKTVLPAYEPSVGAMQLAILVGVCRIFGVAASVFSTLTAWREMFSNQIAMGVLHAGGALIGGMRFPDRPWFGIMLGLLAAALVYIPLTLWNLSRAAHAPAVS